MSKNPFSKWEHNYREVLTQGIRKGFIISRASGEKITVKLPVENSMVACHTALDLVRQANAAEVLRALALAVIAMPAGAGVDDPAHTGYNASLRTLAAVMLAKAEGGK